MTEKIIIQNEGGVMERKIQGSVIFKPTNCPLHKDNCMGCVYCSNFIFYTDFNQEALCSYHTNQPQKHNLTSSLAHLEILDNLKEEDFSEIIFKYYNTDKQCYDKIYLYPDKLPYGVCKYLITTIKEKVKRLLDSLARE